MSSTGIACMKKRGYGAFLRACISLIALILVCFMWVDDNSHQQTARSVEESGEDVVDETQSGLDYWVGFLTTTGGAINPDKSYWYLLDYRWTGTQWVYRKAREMEGGLTAPNPEGIVLPLKWLEAHEASKQLGILTAPDDNMQAQLKHLKAKATKFAENLKGQGLLSRNEAWINMTHTVGKTPEYPMPATTIKEK